MTDLKSQIAFFPHSSGCYLMRDETDKIIYVGKAKDLNKRVSQYFQTNINNKTKALMHKVKSISYITMPSETEALLLENNLIKEHLPFYNIKLTDGKTYPYLIITNEEHPRLIITKKIAQPARRIYGPFPQGLMAKNLVVLLNRIYPFRKCKNIPKKPCLYFELGQCLAPCINNGIVYEQYIKEIDRFFKNQASNPLEQRIKSLISTHSNNLNYEHCLVLKNSLALLTEINKQLVDFKKQENIDYVAYDKTVDTIYLVIMKRRSGIIKDVYKKQIDYYLSEIDAIRQFLHLYYSFDISCSKVIMPNNINDIDFKIFTQSTKQDQETLAVCQKLASEYKEQQLLLSQIKTRDHKIVTDFFQELYNFVPKRIDVLDIAHLFGTNVVGGVVVFDHFVVKKDLFRYYKLDDGANDLASLTALVKRRYAKVENIPDLVLIDGGPNQVTAVQTALQTINKLIPVGGLKKNNHHRLTSFITDNLYEIPLSLSSAIYKVLINLDETCHQYAIRKYRELKLKDTTLTKLDKIKGIGTKTITKLLMQFNSYQEIISADDTLLHRCGLNKTQILIIRRELAQFVKNS